MILDDFPGDASLDQIEEIAVERFRALRREIYKLLPSDCLLKPRNVLSNDMVGTLDMDMVRAGLIEKRDICSVCAESECSHNKVEDRPDRIFKIHLLNETRDSKPQ